MAIDDVEKKKSDVQFLITVGQAIQELGNVSPSFLYTELLTKRMTLEQFEHAVLALKNAGFVREEEDHLIWIGPKT